MTTGESVVPEPNATRGFTQRLLDGIEKMGNKVPHPVLMFLYLIILVIVLSHLLYLAGVSVTEQIAVPASVEVMPEFYEDTTEPGYYTPLEPYDGDYEIQEVTIPVRSLLTVEGIRFIFTSFLPNFANFAVIGVTFVALLGAGVAEEAGLMNALIRKLVAVSPRWALSFIIIFVGVLSSVASDAGYLILIPLAAAAFMSVGRHPLAGLAAAFAGVAAIFSVNILITPLDAMLTEITNESIALAGGVPITIVANFFFSVGSSVVLSIVAAIITDRVIERRLGTYHGNEDAGSGEQASSGDRVEITPEAEARGLRYALFAFLGILAVILLLTLPEGSPLRDPETGAVIGTTPFMDSLLFLITLFFLIAGIGFGIGAGTFKSSNDVIRGVVKTFASLAGLIFMLLMISQFIAHFNYSNLPRVIAVALAGLLEQANIGALPLLIGFILVIVLLDFIMPGSIPKWAIFAPIFVPLFIQLGIAPQSVFAAYRIGDSPVNTLTPLMVYLPFIVTIAQRYQKDAGIGTIVALMLPYALVILIAWIVFFIIWFVLGIPLGPGYPVSVP
jgi:aminobenzoyl-glutamate transport protein